MAFRIVYRSAFIHKGRWIPKIAYVADDKPGVLEGDPRCPYNTRDAAIKATSQLEADLRDFLAGVEPGLVVFDQPD